MRKLKVITLEEALRRAKIMHDFEMRNIELHQTSSKELDAGRDAEVGLQWKGRRMLPKFVEFVSGLLHKVDDFGSGYVGSEGLPCKCEQCAKVKELVAEANEVKIP